ncbi:MULTISPECIES: GAF and ANTAR domain-containing protein [Mumia]|uniref:GAF and ANTAR domain-containing protein n=1 Tax=Mumia TaxID=1546255 RepID=UPI0014240921|nr:MULTISPECIES: GAF and ANTAR domain-containing protein [unclassified Mumia]QMW65345.1 GAF and ANTAR domain-containing protein [Mumia sp. ZJ1417]
MTDEVLDHHELADLVEDLHAADSAEQTAEQIITRLCETVEMDRGGVTMIRGGGRLDTVSATDDLIKKADELQVALGEGPARSDDWDETLRLGDLRRERRWPRWTKAVTDLGVASLLGVSLAPSSRRIGVVTLYSEDTRFFDDDDVAFAHIFARHAAIALFRAEREENLEIALDARKLIGQAQGILMERYGLDEPRAFEVLRRYSQQHNLKLRAVARMLVETRTLPS